VAELSAQTLFQSDAPLVLELEADFGQLLKDRGQESEERPGRMTLQRPGGEVSVPLKLRTRGNFRLRDHICPFPPLRLNFPTDSIAGTPLEGQDKLKLVTHCRDWDRYEQNVLEEYLAYRIYNLLTDVGFRVQLALITYRDTSGEHSAVSRLGFLIEDEEALAARLGGQMLEVPSAHPDDFVPRQAGLMYVFEFMIGNTDWSLVQFHNVKLIRIVSEYFPIPYDFDFSGLVDAPYAGPNPALAQRISTVSERLYWGICSDDIDYRVLFDHFNGHREAILELIQGQAGLTERNARLASAYVESIYEIINDRKEADRMIVKASRRVDRGRS